MRTRSVLEPEDAQQPSCRRVLTTGEVATVLRLSVTQVKRLTDEGALPCAFKTGHGDRLFLWGDVHRVYEQRGRAAVQTRAQRLAAIGGKPIVVRELRLRLCEAKGAGRIRP